MLENILLFCLTTTVYCHCHAKPKVYCTAGNRKVYSPATIWWAGLRTTIWHTTEIIVEKIVGITKWVVVAATVVWETAIPSSMTRMMRWPATTTSAIYVYEFTWFIIAIKHWFLLL